jgi:uncharacterized membrane protein
MFDLINGLPVHPLVVHAVVVLLPLACVGTVAIAVRQSWRERYGILVVAFAAASVVLLPIASSSGEELQNRVGRPDEHAELGDSLIWFAIPLLLLSAALVWMDRRQRAALDPRAGTPTTDPAPHRPGVFRALAALAVVAALAATVQTYRVGDSGAKAAWGERIASSHGGGDSDK